MGGQFTGGLMFITQCCVGGDNALSIQMVASLPKEHVLLSEKE